MAVLHLDVVLLVIVLATKNRSLKEDWIAYVCREVLRVSLSVYVCVCDVCVCVCDVCSLIVCGCNTQVVCLHCVYVT